jgi:hypothetical protein
LSLDSIIETLFTLLTLIIFIHRSVILIIYLLHYAKVVAAWRGLTHHSTLSFFEHLSAIHLTYIDRLIYINISLLHYYYYYISYYDNYIMIYINYLCINIYILFRAVLLSALSFSFSFNNDSFLLSNFYKSSYIWSLWLMIKSFSVFHLVLSFSYSNNIALLFFSLSNNLFSTNYILSFKLFLS